MDREKLYSLHATCARGFEPYLCRELAALGIAEASECGGGAQFRASFEQAMKVCLWSRMANKVEILLGDCYAVNDEAIYELGRKIDLSPWFSPDKTFCVHAHSSDPKFKNALFLSLKVKDGVVDNMRDVWGRRCSIDTERPDIVLNLTVVQRRARLYIELHGDGLSMRGYRRRQLAAPIRETLAASMIAASGWDGSTPFCDPMCGSGTLAIEAAMIATQTAPGIQRHFGFEKLPFFGDVESQWQVMRREARELARTKEFCRRNRRSRYRCPSTRHCAKQCANGGARFVYSICRRIGPRLSCKWRLRRDESAIRRENIGVGDGIARILFPIGATSSNILRFVVDGHLVG